MFEHLGESSKHSAQLIPIDVYSIKIASNVKIFFLNLFCPAQMYGSSSFFMFLS